jgi:MFS family permease
VALLVALAAPRAGRLADVRGERLCALFGFASAGLGLAALGIPRIALDGGVSLVLLIPLGLGLGMLFAPTSRVALNSVPQAWHGHVSGLLSLGGLLRAMIGAAAAGTAISGGPTASAVHAALLVAGGACLVGVPVTLRLEAPATARRGPKQTLRAGRGEEEVATALINLLG